MKKRLLTISCMLLALAACTQLPTETEIPPFDPAALNQTAAYLATADFYQTQSAIPTATLPPAITWTPIPTIDRPRPLAKSPTLDVPCNQAAPGNPIDITIPDGTKLTPSEGFSKTWRLKNVGSCTWTRQYAIEFFSGNSMEARYTQYLKQEVEPGDVIDLTVDMVAPDLPGVYQSNWMLKDREGEIFGIGPNGDAPFWVQIEVVPISTATPQPTVVVTGTPMVFKEGTVGLGLGDQFDFDEKLINPQDSNLADVRYQTGDLTPILLSVLNGTKWALFEEGQPEYSDCENASMTDETLGFDESPILSSVCFRSSEDRIGWFELDQITGEQITISFLVWSTP